MPKRVVKRARGKKQKLRKGSVYKLFGVGMIGAGLVFIAAMSGYFSVLVSFDRLSINYFGRNLHSIFPVLLLLLGFFFLQTRLLFSRAHMTLGFLFLFFSLEGIFKNGVAGNRLYQLISGIVGGFIAEIVLFVALFVGAVVFFDTSIDELGQGIKIILRNMGRFVPRTVFTRPEKPAFVIKDNNKQAIIHNEVKSTKQEKNSKLADIPPLSKKAVQKGVISDSLVSNLAQNGIWDYPSLNLLADGVGQKADRGNVNKIASNIEKTLESFGIRAKVVEVNPGPAVTQYALEIALGTKVSKITSLSNDLALATEAPTGQIRIEAPIPGRNLVGVEIPNRSLEIVSLKSMLASPQMQKGKSKLTVSLGLDVSGMPVVADIARMPHILIAGTTGSGKSVALNCFIASILFRASPSEVRIIMIDPKRVELAGYNGIPHLLHPVIVETDKILSSLKWAVSEMERRYKLFAERGVRNIDSYNELSGFQALPYILIFIDELADLMSYAPVEVEDTIARLAQMARAVGLHLVVATQRPSVDVITGLIKANIPCRIAFNVSSMTDSRVILDMPGAEKLLGRGDMLFIPPDQAKPTRIQGTFVSEREIKRIVDFLKEKNPVVNYTEEITKQPVNLKRGGINMSSEGNDEQLESAIRVVCQYDRASASLLQRKLSIGYSRAARILDTLEEMGVVGHAEGSKPRDVLVKNADEFIAGMHDRE